MEIINKSKNKIIILCSIIISYIITSTIIYFTSDTILSANAPVILLVILFIPFIYITINYFVSNHYIPYTEMIFALFFSIITFIGKSIYETHSLVYLYTGFFRLFLGIIGNFLLYTILFFYILIFTNYIAAKKNIIFSRKITPLITFCSWLLLFAIHFVCYLTYYPGFLSYDTPVQFEQIFGITSWTTHHPPLHTFILMICINLGNILKIEGLIIYSIISILIVISIEMIVVTTLYNNNVPIYFCIFCYLYYLLVPTLHIYSFVPTKDVFFTCFLILFFINLKRAIINKINFKILINIIVFGILSALLRNNMTYVMIILFITSLILTRFNLPKQISVSLLSIVAFCIIVTKIFFPLSGIISTDTVQETISVPISQIAYVYNNKYDNLTEEQKNVIISYLPTVYKYNPRFADHIKFDFNSDLYNENSKQFWDLYLSLAFKYPAEYLNAFLELNIVYWYPYSNFPDEFSNRMYIETWTWDIPYYPFERNSKLPALLDKYEEIANFEAEWMRLPLLYQYFSLSFPFITMYVCLFICVKNKRTDMILILGGFILLFLTYLLGPVSNYRYVYTFYLAMPYYITSSIFKNKPNEHEI